VGKVGRQAGRQKDRREERWEGRQRDRRVERWEGRHKVPQDMRAARQESSKVSGQQGRKEKRQKTRHSDPRSRWQKAETTGGQKESWAAKQADSKSGGQTVSVIG
jgi:hypothetical protein